MQGCLGTVTRTKVKGCLRGLFKALIKDDLWLGGRIMAKDYERSCGDPRMSAL